MEFGTDERVHLCHVAAKPAKIEDNKFWKSRKISDLEKKV